MPSTRLRGILAPAALLVLVALLGACDTTATPSASVSPSESSSGPCGADEIAASGIDGTVVDSDGSPLADIFVQIEAGDGFRGTTRTGEEGVFTAPGVTGDFVITTVDIEYAPVTQHVSVPCGETIEVELVLTPADG